MREQRRNIFFFDWYENSQIIHFEEFFRTQKKGKEVCNEERKQEHDKSVIKTRKKGKENNRRLKIYPLNNKIPKQFLWNPLF
uniref:Uncharacterized protein n=1 Tax=Oryza rufipogon TaxID=4529 RepID=A0A0E0RHS6_ORYRU